MKAIKGTLYYLTSTVKQHLGLLIWMLLILSLSSFVLVMFYGENLRGDEADQVTISFETTAAPMYLTGEFLEELDELQEKYHAGLYKACYFYFYPQNAVIDEEYYPELRASYSIDDSNRYLYFSEEEIYEETAVLYTNLYPKEETVELDGHTFRVKHTSLHIMIIPYTALLEYQMPIDYFEVSFSAASMRTISKINNELQEMFPDWRVNNSEIGNVAQMERRSSLIYIMLVLLAIANIGYSYWYCLNRRKEDAYIFFVIGCSRLQRNLMMIAELIWMYGVSYCIGVILYCGIYPLLYQWKIVSYAELPEAETFLKTFLIMGCVLCVIFGVMCVAYNRRLEYSK